VGLTQFSRILEELEIELMCANSSQANGRVERANKMLQDRLIKEMRPIPLKKRAHGCPTLLRILTAALIDTSAIERGGDGGITSG
jgi:hypothetical protein